jgi:uncharacterized protein YbjT (DUF2867 family)
MNSAQRFPAPIIIVGATSESGRELARRLRADGQRVVAVSRGTRDTALLLELGVECRTADARDEEQVRAAFADLGRPAAVVSILAGGLNGDPAIESAGNINIIGAAEAVGAERFVLVTTVGCGDSYAVAPEMSKKLLARIIEHKNLAEARLFASSLDWTVVRPGGLTIPQPTGNAILVEGSGTLGMLNRTDLGGLLHQVIRSPAASRKIYAATDRSRVITPAGGQVQAAAL